MEIRTKLQSAELKRAADEVRQFGRDFQTKIQTLLERLVEKGINVAEATVGKFGNKITFSKQVDNLGVVMVATETDYILAEWLRGNTPVEAIVSPLLMAEFGAGPHAIVWEGQLSNTDTLPDGKRIGRGTFPNQTHAYENSWWYMDLNGKWHQAFGVTPTRPIHNAMLEIIAQVNATVREVFGNG